VATLEELKDQQRRQWTGNAPTWDAQHERREQETGPVSDWLCREAGLAPAMRVLDLACGSGHPALNAARLVSPAGSVFATDMVPEMVDITRRRAAEAGLTNIEVRVMDAEAIDLPDDSFDAVTCRFGIMFCTDPSKAVQDIRRVLKDGSKFAMACWAPPERSPGQTVGNQALERFGRPQPAVDYDVPGVYQLAPDGKLQKLLEGAGFRDVRVEEVTIVSEYESFDAFLAPGAMRMGALRTVLTELPEAGAEHLKQILHDVLAPYTDSAGVIRLPLTPLCAVGTK
jgi:ubiquinone/menaquinone biosynthesis C-methylase UbiE